MYLNDHTSGKGHTPTLSIFRIPSELLPQNRKTFKPPGEKEVIEAKPKIVNVEKDIPAHPLKRPQAAKPS